MKEETCIKKGFNSPVFWKDGWKGKTKSGTYAYRAFEFNQFLRKLESDSNENVVGIQFKENNVLVLVEDQANTIANDEEIEIEMPF